jgi:hypothetical protein
MRDRTFQATDTGLPPRAKTDHDGDRG